MHANAMSTVITKYEGMVLLFTTMSFHLICLFVSKSRGLSSVYVPLDNRHVVSMISFFLRIKKNPNTQYENALGIQYYKIIGLTGH